MNSNRRDFIRTSLGVAATLASHSSTGIAAVASETAQPRDDFVQLIDSNVHLFDWPFRRLKYGVTTALLAKLKRHGVTEAWAGSFEALFTKDISGVNVRLAEECRKHGSGVLIPVGSVNPVWPDWEEDLRRCHEVHGMRAIRLHPCYQTYSLEHPEFARFLEQAADRGLLVQIVLEMEDRRVQHPLVSAPVVNPIPLVELMQKVPRTRVQLLGGSFGWLASPQAAALLEIDRLTYDISSIEGIGGVLRLIEGRHWSIRGKVPVERLIFGTHAPYFPVENALLKLMESPFTAEQLAAIISANGRRFFGTA